MPWIIAQLVRLGIPSKLVKPLLIAFGVIALVVVLGVAKCSYDRRVVENANAKADAKAANKTIEINEKAAQERRSDDARSSQESGQIDKVIDNAPKPNVPTSDARQRFYRCVELQQSARKAGKPVPTC